MNYGDIFSNRPFVSFSLFFIIFPLVIVFRVCTFALTVDFVMCVHSSRSGRSTNDDDDKIRPRNEKQKTCFRCFVNSVIVTLTSPMHVLSVFLYMLSVQAAVVIVFFKFGWITLSTKFSGSENLCHSNCQPEWGPRTYEEPLEMYVCKKLKNFTCIEKILYVGVNPGYRTTVDAEVTI